jgi:hypothetical protein
MCVFWITVCKRKWQVWPSLYGIHMLLMGKCYSMQKLKVKQCCAHLKMCQFHNNVKRSKVYTQITSLNHGPFKQDLITSTSYKYLTWDKSLHFTIVWPCIVTDSLWIKPTDALNSNFIGITTLHVAVHRLWYVLCSCDHLLPGVGWNCSSTLLLVANSHNCIKRTPQPLYG